MAPPTESLIGRYPTFRKWVRNAEGTPDESKSKIGKPGRPRVEEGINDVIIQSRKETGWGYQHRPNDAEAWAKSPRHAVKNVLMEMGLGPDPHDHKDTWSDFLKPHADTIWQCDERTCSHTAPRRDQCGSPTIWEAPTRHQRGQASLMECLAAITDGFRHPGDHRSCSEHPMPTKREVLTTP